jgi:alpha-D-ribose 1-methylphosphonate 5-triphosphate synthase subunit PhnL
MKEPIVRVEGASKTFTLHNQGGVRLPVMTDAGLAVRPGECVALVGESGAGKSTLMRMIYGNYRTDAGRIVVGGVDVAAADPRTVIALRRDVVGYVSQFLRVVPRVAALDVVAEPAVAQGLPAGEARERAAALLARLNVPERLWGLPPATFSGGEQQRVNVARGFVTGHRVLLVDEPTASLDAANRDVVVAMIAEKKEAGVALLGIFHDEAVRAAVADREVDVTAFRPAPAMEEPA